MMEPSTPVMNEGAIGSGNAVAVDVLDDDVVEWQMRSSSRIPGLERRVTVIVAPFRWQEGQLQHRAGNLTSILPLSSFRPFLISNSRTGLLVSTILRNIDALRRLAVK